MFKFIAFLIFHILLTGTMRGTITGCKVLQNEATGQVVIIYEHMHAYFASEATYHQNKRSIDNIEKILEDDTETAILYEGAKWEGYLEKLTIQQMGVSSLCLIKKFMDQLEDDQWNPKVKLVNIDNGEHLYDQVGYALANWSTCKKYSTIECCNSDLQEMRDHSKFSSIKHLSKYELDLHYYNKILEVFYKLKLDINKLDPSIKNFINEKMDKIEKSILSSEINSVKTRIKNLFHFSSDIDMKEEMLNHTLDLKDLNILQYILNHPNVDKFIIFVEARSSQTLPQWLENHFSFKQLLNRNLYCTEEYLNANPDEHNKLTECLDLMINSNGIYQDRHQTPSQKKFNELMIKVRQRIESPDEQLSVWHIDNLKYVLKKMKKEKLKDIDANILRSYKKTLVSIEKDFAQESSQQHQILEETLSSFDPKFDAYGICLNSSNVDCLGTSVSLPQIGKG